MNQTTIDLILKMQDQATAVYKKFEAGILGGVKRTGDFISKNWASIGVSIGAAFYVAIRALEKVDQIAKKVSKSASDINAAKAAAELQKVAQYAEDAQSLVDELIIRGSLFAVGVGNSVATFFATLYTIILIPLAAIEEALNKLGITNSTMLQELKTEGMKHMMEYSKAATDAFGAALASSEKLGIGLEDNKEEWIKNLEVMQAVKTAMASGGNKVYEPPATKEKTQKVFSPEEMMKEINKFYDEWEETDNRVAQDIIAVNEELQLAALTRKYGAEEATLMQWQARAIEMAHGDKATLEEIDRVYRERKAELDIQAAQKTMDKVKDITSQVSNVLLGFSKNRTQKEIQDIERRKNAELEAIDAELAKETLSEEQRNLLLDKRKERENAFNKQIRDAKKRQFQAEKEAAIIESIIATAVAVVKSLPNIPLAIAVGILGAAKTAVIAGQPTPEFQQGTPPGGFIVPPGYPNDSFPIKVSSGERVDVTPEGETRGASVIININAPGTPVELVKRAVEEGMKRTGLSVDKYFVQNRENTVLS